MVVSKFISIKTSGHTDIIDITGDVQENLIKTKLKNGIVNVSVPGSTAGITTAEFEPGQIADLKKLFQDLIPEDTHYKHDDTWGDANGYAHLRSALIGTSKSFPFIDAKLSLGTWQQIVLIDFDNRPRLRKIILQFIGG